MSSDAIVVHKGRTVTIEISLAFSVAGDTITSEIRKGRSSSSPLIASWTVVIKPDGTNKNLILTLDNSTTSAITEKIGYMDLKRVSAGEPLPIFEDPLQVSFKDVVTV